MLSDGNKNGKKNQEQHSFLHISWPLLLHDYSVKLPSSRFMKEMSYVVTKKKMLLVFLFAYIIYFCAVASISHFFTPRL